MKRYNFRNILPAALLALGTLGFTACNGDLDVNNINPQQVSDFNQDAILNKVYSNLVLTGQSGPAGDSDLPEDIDEGASNMIRQIWNANELSTDEAKCIWGDAGIPEYNNNSWSDSHKFTQALYYRLTFGVTMSNFFLDQATSTDAKTLQQRAEVRFLRALHYYYLMDLFGNPPFLTTVSSTNAPQIKRADLFDWVVAELKAIDGENAESAEVLADARTNTYGRVDKAAAYMLLARLYLNAQVYTGTAQWQLAKDYAKKAINSGYSLSTVEKNGYSGFQLLFMGDNDTNGAQNEIILPALHDGAATQTWGGCLFLVAGAVDKDMLAAYPTGTSENWGGNRAVKQFVQKFFPNDDAPAGIPTAVAEAAQDDRALFYTAGKTLDIKDISSFKEGYPYVKFLAKRADGNATKHTQFVDTDFPMLRLGEAYLIYAEADARLNGNTCSAEGVDAIKTLRKRAHAATNFTSFTLSQVEDEWSREMGHEGVRRQTLIRFGHFGGQNAYKWQWMGGTQSGSSFDARYNLFAIPASDLNANSNLEQNPGFKNK